MKGIAYTSTDPKSECCNGPLTMYDKGNGEKYLACYHCYKATNPDGSLKKP